MVGSYFVDGLLRTGWKACPTAVRRPHSLIRFPIRGRPAPDGLESLSYGCSPSTFVDSFSHSWTACSGRAGKPVLRLFAVRVRSLTAQRIFFIMFLQRNSNVLVMEDAPKVCYKVIK
jgi:hypothetical protein